MLNVHSFSVLCSLLHATLCRDPDSIATSAVSAVNFFYSNSAVIYECVLEIKGLGFGIIKYDQITYKQLMKYEILYKFYVT